MLGAVGDGGGNFSITKTGPGKLVLTAPGTYGGGTTIDGGILNISSDSALGPRRRRHHLQRQRHAAAATLQLAASYSGASIAATRGISVSAGDDGTVDTNGNAACHLRAAR